MTSLAFVRKDLRISARAGAIFPGVPTLLFLEALAFGAAGAWAITVGVAPAPVFWSSLVTSLASISFFFAALGPMTSGAVGAAQEAVPEIAESLASAPVSTLELFLGKAALPAIQGLAVQLSLLPVWAFLVGSGVVGPGAALRVMTACCAIVPVAAIVGVTRFSGMAARRLRGISGFRRAGQGQPGGQLWLLVAAVFWSSQIFHAVGLSSSANGLWARVVDATRPVLPMLLVSGGARTMLFRLPVPSIALTLPLLGMFAVSRAAQGIAANVRTEPRDRRLAVRAVVIVRAIGVAYLAAALWPASPGAGSAIAGIAAVVAVIFGIPGEERVREAIHGARICILAGALATLAGGPAALAFWAGVAVLCAAVAAALPPRRIEAGEARGIAIAAVLVASIAMPLAALWLGPLSPVLGPIANVFGAFACVSPLVAVASLAGDLFGSVPLWGSLDAAVPAFSVVRPWAASPLFFGAVAGIAIWRRSRKKG